MGANTELKILSDNGSSFVVGGYGVVFGGHDASESKDRFTARTDFWFDRITATPMVMYQHGQDGTLKRTVVGRVTSTKPDDIGLWVEAQITAAKQYAAAIRQLIAKGVLGWSSGSVPHLVDRIPSDTPGVKEITSWPIVELSLTPTPAEYRTLGVKELKSLAAVDPLLLPVARAAEQATKEAKVAMSDLPDSAFALVDKGDAIVEGKTWPLESRHYPHHDEHGTVDPDTLADSLKDAIDANESIAVVAHLKRHAMALETGHADDAHTKQWTDGSAPTALVLTMEMAQLAEDLAADRIAMERTGVDTKSGVRIIASRRMQLKSLHTRIGYLIENAEGIERGDDGTAQVELYRAAFEMLNLEEVA